MTGVIAILTMPWTILVMFICLSIGFIGSGKKSRFVIIFLSSLNVVTVLLVLILFGGMVGLDVSMMNVCIGIFSLFANFLYYYRNIHVKIESNVPISTSVQENI